MAEAMSPYRDPRTAFGNQQRIDSLRRSRIPVGEVIEGPPAAQQAAAPAQQAAAPKPARFGGIGGALRTAGPAIGAAALGAGEALDIGKVLANPATSGLDVATQTAEGVGRLASAGAGAMGGAKLGAMAAPFLGPLAPAGPLIGGVVGGGIGYLSADKAIQGGRQAMGADPRSPVQTMEQLQPAAAAPAQPTRQAPTLAAGPNAGNGRGFVNPPLVQGPGDIGGAPEGTITRQGNSYSGTNVKEGAAIVGPDGTPRTARGSLTVLDTSAGRTADQQQLARLVDERREREAMPVGGMTGIGGGAFGLNYRRDLGPGATEMLGLNARQRATLLGQRYATDTQRYTSEQQRSALERGQDMSLAGRQITGANDSRIESLRGRNQRDIAEMQGRTQREVATIGADARTTAAESSANARAAAAESAARRYIPVPGGQDVRDIGGVPVTVRTPDRVFDVNAGRFIDQPAQAGQAGQPKAAPTKGAVVEKNGASFRFKGGDPSKPESWEKV
jgi:hypothetical protein